MDRRRFLALSVTGSAASALTVRAAATSVASPWRASSWTARVGEKVAATNKSGHRRTVRVHRVDVERPQRGTTGESFAVVMTGTGPIPSGQYRLSARDLSTTAYLITGEHGYATLVVNSLRPAGRSAT